MIHVFSELDRKSRHQFGKKTLIEREIRTAGHLPSVCFPFFFCWTCMFLSWSGYYGTRFIFYFQLYIYPILYPFFLQVSGSSQGNGSCRVSHVLSPLSHDFRIKAREDFVSSLQPDVCFISLLAQFAGLFYC